MSEEVKYLGGYRLTPKHSVKSGGYDNSKSGWKDEDVINMSYKAAGIVYDKYRWDTANYTKDDFQQEAAIYILNKFNMGYFDANNDNIFPIVYRLIDGHFVYNKYKKHRPEFNIIRLDSEKFDNMPEDFYEDDLLRVNEDQNPEDICIKEEDIREGMSRVIEIISGLNSEPYITRKYNYVGELEGGIKVKLTEYNIGKLIIEGKSLHDILEIYGCNNSNSGASSKSANIARTVKRTKDKIVKGIKSLSEESKDSVRELFEFSKLVDGININ